MRPLPWLLTAFSGLVGCATLSGLDDFRTSSDGGGTATGGAGGTGGAAPSCAMQCPGYRCDDGVTCGHWTSCEQLRDAGAPSGTYEIDPGTGVIDVFCDNEADGGGWTLLLKASGRASTFRYSSALWTDETLLNETSNDLAPDEAKLPAYLTLDVDELRVVMATNGERRGLAMRIQDAPARSLRAWLMGPETTTDLQRAEWLSLVPNAQLLPYCNHTGLNVLHNNECCAKVRIGIATNNEDNCDTPDAALGVGLSTIIVGCQQGPPSVPDTTVGLAFASCSSEIDTKSFAYVYGR